MLIYVCIRIQTTERIVNNDSHQNQSSETSEENNNINQDTELLIQYRPSLKEKSSLTSSIIEFWPRTTLKTSSLFCELINGKIIWR